jgi:hypothetical protein
MCHAPDFDRHLSNIIWTAIGRMDSIGRALQIQKNKLALLPDSFGFPPVKFQTLVHGGDS